MIKANIKIGNASIQVEAETQVALVDHAGFWGEVPTECGQCKSSNVGFFSRRAQGYLYVGVQCQDCSYTLNFGQNQEGGRLFIKSDEGWKPPYQSSNDASQASNPANDHQAAATQPDDDDIPF